MSSKPPPLSAGTRIGGYELVRRIGRGGMAEVWCARRISDRKASKFVAIKVVADHYVGDPRYQRMFRAEAELSGLLNHVNIVQVFDEGEDAGRSYLVMEWIDGVNLLKVGAALTFIEDEEWKHKIIAYIIGQLLYALSYAHSITMHDGDPLGIVHRDVSPQNILISNNGEVKLTDFGVAHYLLEESSGIHVKGKVRYMAPEQLGGKTRDPRVDLYAVGAILHELLDGHRFRHHVEDQRQMYLEVLGGKVPVLSCAAPPELEALRLDLLQAEPADRVPSAEAALELLERYPGFGDARRDLMQLCGGLTGVLKPRVGPGGSRPHARASVPKQSQDPPEVSAESAKTDRLAASSAPPKAPALPSPIAASSRGTTPAEPSTTDPMDGKAIMARANPSRTLRIATDQLAELAEPHVEVTPTPHPTKTPRASAHGELRATSPRHPAAEADGIPPDTAVMTPSMVQRAIETGFESGPIGLRAEGTDPQREISTLTAVQRQAHPSSSGSTMVARQLPRRQGAGVIVLLGGLFVLALAVTGAYYAWGDRATPKADDPPIASEPAALPDGPMQPSASEAGTGQRPPDPGDPDHSKSVPGKGTMNNDDLFATRFDATGTEATGTGPAVPAEDEATTEGDDSTTADDPSALQDVGSVDRKHPKRSDRDTPKGVLTVAVDGKHAMEVKVGRQRLRTIASLKSESFRLPVGMRSVKWRRPGEPTWKTTPVRVKTKCERQLRIPSTTVKTFGTCE